MGVNAVDLFVNFSLYLQNKRVIAAAVKAALRLDAKPSLRFGAGILKD